MTTAQEPSPVRTITPNKYAGACRVCGVQVAAGAGQAVKMSAAGRWETQHTGGCPTADPTTPTQPKAATVDFAPTAEQVRCAELFATGADLVIQAGAGAGKTSTLRLLANQALAAGRRGQYTAFNKAIVKDTAGRMPGNVTCSTMHSLAHRAIVGPALKARLESPRQQPEEEARILGIGPMFLTVGGESREMAAGWLAGQALAAVTSFCQSADAEITARHFGRVEAITPADEDGNVDWSAQDDLAAALLPFARKAWADLNAADGKLRFGHDHYLKMWQLGGPRINADFIMLDEAQDADPVQVDIIAQQRRYGTQIVVVGDESQSIYGWRGAVDALAKFEATGANVAFLTQSFRFGDAVADVANGLLARIPARLRLTGFGPVASVVGPIAAPDAILARTNAGAIRALLAKMEEGYRTHLVGGGKDVVAFCRAALALQAGQRTSHPELACFATWCEVQAYVEEERGADLKLMCSVIDTFGAAVIIEAIERQPDERDADIVISTAHKAKGREWDAVQIAGDFVPPKDGAVMSVEELRLAYVAVTRAKTALDIEAAPHFAAGPGTPPAPPAGPRPPAGPGPQGEAKVIPFTANAPDGYFEDKRFTAADVERAVATFQAELDARSPREAPQGSPEATNPASAPETADTASGLHEVTLGKVTYFSRFVGRCDRCGTAARHEIPATAHIRNRWVKWPPAWTCECGTPVQLRAVAGTLSEGRCDPRCWNAVGYECTCSCGGAYHGDGHGPQGTVR